MVLVGLKQYPGSIFHPGITLLRPTLAIRPHKVLKGQEEQLQKKRWTFKKKKKSRAKDFKSNRERNQQIRPKVAKQGKRSRGAVIMKKDPTAKRCWKSWASASHGSWNEANPQPFDTLAGQGAAQLQFHGRVWPLIVKNRVTKKGESGTDDGIRNWKYCKSWKAAASPVTSPLQQAEESVTVQHRVSSWSPETVSWVGAQLGHGCKVFPSSSISFLPGAPLPPVTPALRHRAVIPPEELLMLQNTPEKKIIQVYE